MQHFLLILSQLRPTNFLLYLLEVLATDGQHIDVFLGAKEEGKVREFFRQGHLHEIYWLLKAEARGLQASLDYGLSEVVNVL